MSADLELSGVVHRYRAGGPAVLDDVHLEVPAGTTTTVLGPSGSGKSTLLAVIAGIATPSAGAVHIDGRSMLGVDPARRGVAMVLQQPHLFPHLSVGENAAFGLAARGVPRRTRTAEAARLLDLVGLRDMAGRRPRELSGGEQQRVALVRALAVEPRVLLLDEPLASLDPRVRETLQDLLRRLVAETGVTTLMVTHDRAEAMSLGDRTALLLDGRVAAHTTPQQLFHRPPNRAAAAFMGVSAFIDGRVDGGVLRTTAGDLAMDDLAGPDRTVTVAIRPEHLREASADGPNVIAGRVTRRTFRGEHWDCEAQTALGVLRVRADADPGAGATMRISLPAHRLFEVEHDTGSGGGPGSTGPPG